VDFLLRLIDFALSRQEQVLEGLAQHTWYVITVLVTAGLFAIVTGVVTRRNLLAKELALALASVFLTIPSLALFVIFICNLHSTSWTWLRTILHRTVSLFVVAYLA